MSDHIQIRRYEEGDAPALAAVFFDSVRQGARGDYTAEQVEAWLPKPVDPHFFTSRASDGRTLLVATDDRDVIAYGDLEPDWHIDHLYCTSRWIGRGVGSRLYAELEADAHTRCLTRLTIEASEPARRLFERRGFHVDRRNDLIRNGVALHNYTMIKDL
jgi:putative acetyltransferase